MYLLESSFNFLVGEELPRIFLKSLAMGSLYLLISDKKYKNHCHFSSGAWGPEVKSYVCSFL